MAAFLSAHVAALALQPERPLVCWRPHAAEAAARWFVERFPGDVYYAVKCNPSARLIDDLTAGGVRHFDVASTAEMRLIAESAPRARMAYMHPVKSRRAISEAYFDHGVRDFALDSLDELDKIRAATGDARDLGLFVRLSVPTRAAALPLHGKFGVDAADAPELLLAARRASERLGVCFHVGSQSLAPDAYRVAMRHVDSMVAKSGAWLDVVDVGGGFPAAYPDFHGPGLDAYVDTIAETFETMLVKDTCALWCEPGRALAAESASLVVRVDLRKGNRLYLNDGAYGALFDAAHLQQKHTLRLIREDGAAPVDAPFELFGPTCDALDRLPEPVRLPADIREGDYIEIGQMGAYGAGLATRFNGFGDYEETTVADAPMLSMYRETRAGAAKRWEGAAS